MPEEAPGGKFEAVEFAAGMGEDLQPVDVQRDE